MRDVRSIAVVCLVIAALMLPIAGTALGKTINVMPGKSTGIADALASANFGDVVLVGCGTYDEGVLVVPDGVTLQGTGDADCVIIRGSGEFPVFLIEGVGAATQISNLTVTVEYGAGADETLRGPGALLTDASPIFMNVIFSGLKGSYGGAVNCTDSSSPFFLSCTFENNQAVAIGGAVACTGGSTPTFEYCLFTDNAAGGSGGTIHAALGSDVDLIGCTIVRGGAAEGSGLSTWDAPGMTLERIIVNDGIQGAAWSGDFDSAPAVSNSDLFGNEGGDWSGALAPSEGVDGNISEWPQFCGPANPDQPYSLNDTSPCAGPPGMNMGAFDIGCEVVSPVPDPDGLPAVSRLHDAYPNPFNPRTTIKYDLHRAGHVDVSVFDVSGRLVKRLVNRTMTAGAYDAVWEGRDDRGRSVAAGVYFFRLKTNETLDTKRMTLIK